MRKLLLKSILLFIIAMTICYATLYLNPKYEVHYLAAIKNKLEKLEKIKGQKIVIIGGSNANFGIDSEQMENILEVPVVNAGLHASLGPKFWIEYVKGNLKKGDILIMSPEYGMLGKKVWTGGKSKAVPITILYTPSKIPILFKDYDFFRMTTIGIFQTIKSYWKEYPFKLSTVQSAFDLRSFDEDNVKGDFMKSVYTGKEIKNKLKFDERFTSWNELKEEKDYFDVKDIKFGIALPSRLDESIDINEAKAFISSISEYSGVPIVNNNTNYFFKRKYFFDTHYHLNNIGRELRTNMLINDINEDFFEGSKNINKQKKNIFLSKNNYEKIELSKIKMSYKAKIKYFDNDSIVISPESTEKLGFLKYKTEKRDYSGYVLKITVKTASEIANKLKFRSSKEYDFDLIKENEDGAFVLCKILSNTIYVSDDTKGNVFSSIGIGFSEGTLKLTDLFTIVKVELMKTNASCDEVMGNSTQDEYLIDASKKTIFFSLNSYTEKSFKISDIINLDSNAGIDMQAKYLAKIKSDSIYLYDFYKDKLLYKNMFKEPLMFKNSKDYQLEINF